MKKIIKQTENNLSTIEEAIKREIKRSTAEVAKKTGLRISYLSDWRYNRINIAYKKMLDIAKKLFC